MAVRRHQSAAKQGRTSRIISFSAELPPDVCAAFRDCCMCTVKYSADPASEIRESVVEMVERVGIRSWAEMEDLVYCYVALNSSELRHFIQDAFLSLCFSRR